MPPVLTHKNRQLAIDLTPLVEAGLEVTFLSADVAAASSTLTVKDINGFAVDQYLLIGELGQETSEIIKTHAATVPSGTTITLAANTSFAHAAGTKVYRIEFNQIEINHATTASGSKTVLATVDIQADQKIQVYTTTSQTSGYYFARFKNAAAATFGGYSDALLYGGWASNTVGHMIEQACRELGITLGNLLSRTDCYDFLNDGLRFVQGKQVHFSHYILNESTLDLPISAGEFAYDLPSNSNDTSSHSSLLNVRIGTGSNLEYVDPRDFEATFEGQATDLVSAASIGATSLFWLFGTGSDFTSSGTLTFFVAGTKYTCTYTGIDVPNLQFTGIPASGSGSITVNIPANTRIYQNPILGTPTKYTTSRDELRLSPVPDEDCHNWNIWIDFEKEVTEVDSDGDTLDAPRYDMMQDYLKWRMKMRVKNNGNLDLNDGHYVMFKEKLNDAIRTSRSTHVHKMKPKVNRISY